MRTRHKAGPRVVLPAGHVVVNIAALPIESLGRPDDAFSKREALALLGHVAPSALALAGDAAMESRQQLLARLAVRTTPLGLAVSRAIATVRGVTSIHVAALADARATAWLDPDLLASVSRAIERDESRLRYRVNETLIELDGTFRATRILNRGGLPSVVTFSFPSTPVLVSALSVLRQRPHTWPEACAALGAAGADSAAAGLFTALVEEGVLVPNVGPSLSSANPLAELRRRWTEECPAPETALRLLNALEASTGGGTLPLDRVEAAEAAALAALHAAGVQPPAGRVLQVELKRPANEVTVELALLREVGTAADLVNAAFASSSNSLASFRRALDDRTSGGEVPLLEALDDVHGVGWAFEPTPVTLVGGLRGFPQPGELPLPQLSAATVDWLQRLAERAALEHSDEVLVGPDDVASLASTSALAPPDTLSVTAQLVGRDETWAVIRHVSASGLDAEHGPACGRDAELARLVRADFDREAALAPDVIFAEVVAAAAPGKGVLSSRPVLRAYEIPIGVESGAPQDHQIPLADLTICVSRGRLVLRSRRLDREVVPRFSTVLHPGLYLHRAARFLYALKAEGIRSGTKWSWGPLESCPRLPRVRRGRVVLAPAQWNVSAETLATARTPGALRRLCERLGMPRFLSAKSEPAALTIDLENEPLLEATLGKLRHLPRVCFEENLVLLRGSCVTSPDGTHAAEIRAPFFATRSERPRTRPRVRAGVTTRTFPPGSDWSFLKLYGCPDALEALLAGPLAEVIERLEQTGNLARWFFIRYDDPDPHVRLRLRGPPGWLLSSALPVVTEALRLGTRGSLVGRLTVDTYVREVERYGGDDAFEHCEAWFGHDSRSVVDLLQHYSGTGTEVLRWRLALSAVRQAHATLVPDHATRLHQLERWRAGLLTEQPDPSAVEDWLSRTFRAVRESLEAQLNGNFPDPVAQFAGRWLEARRETEQRSLEGIRSAMALASRGDEDSDALAAVANSLFHMHCNRVFQDYPRLQELKLYDALMRLERSALARGRG